MTIIVMRTTSEGIALIKEFEGCSLVAYQDGGGKWTIGYGHTRGVKEGHICSREQAEKWLLEDIQIFEKIVEKCVPEPQLNNNQFSALVSFVFNVGLGHPGTKDGFQLLKDGSPSTMLKLLHAGNLDMAAEEFPKWDRVGGATSQGLLRRRLAEMSLFMKRAENA